MELTTFRFLYARLVNDCFPVNLRVDVLQQTPACMWTRGGSGAAQQFSQPAKSSGFVGTHCALADKRDPDHLDAMHRVPNDSEQLGPMPFFISMSALCSGAARHCDMHLISFATLHSRSGEVAQVRSWASGVRSSLLQVPSTTQLSKRMWLSCGFVTVCESPPLRAGQ